VGSDQGRGLFVAAFDLVSEDQKGPSKKKLRKLSKIVSDQDLFASGEPGTGPFIEWGAKDRLYRYHGGRFDIVRNTSNGTASFEHREHYDEGIHFDLSEFVGVRVAPFGTVLEFDSHISVLLNSGDVLRFPGEPVNWRIYPRSLNYLNHLHIIYDDYLEILAFTNDYFVPPGQRRFGTEPISADER
jgi:hypothetical protein